MDVEYFFIWVFGNLDSKWFIVSETSKNVIALHNNSDEW